MRFVVAAAVALVAPAAVAHAFLDHATPAVGSEVHGAPAAVTLWFTEPVEPAFSTVKVLDGRGAPIDASDAGADPRDPSVLRVTLRPLAPGTYRVVWHVVSVDTHVTDGDFAFTVVP